MNRARAKEVYESLLQDSRNYMELIDAHEWKAEVLKRELGQIMKAKFRIEQEYGFSEDDF